MVNLLCSWRKRTDVADYAQKRPCLAPNSETGLTGRKERRVVLLRHLHLKELSRLHDADASERIED